MKSISPKRLWVWRAFFALGLPVLLLVALELTLRLFGVGFSERFWVEGNEPGTVKTNYEFARHYSSRKNPPRPFFTQMTVTKPADTVRVFLLGESAAFGTPDPAFGPSRLMQVMLEERYPGKRIEVINAAMMGIDSFVLRRIARECAQYEPDLFIIYTGNNELIGLHVPLENESALWATRPLALFMDWCRATRVGQLACRMVNAWNPPPVQDMSFLRRQRRAADDPRTLKVLHNFRQNLAEVIQLGDFPKILATVAVNVRDFPPLGSLHRPGLSEDQLKLWNEAYAQGMAEEQGRRYASAVVQYQTAAALDQHYAELHYRLGLCFKALNNEEKAREHLTRAWELDTLRFRADPRINRIVRELATAHAARGVELCDLEAAFSRHPTARMQLPGRELFYEHVHTTFTGTYWLARHLVESTEKVLRNTMGAPAGDGFLSQDECARRLAFTALDEYNVAQAMTRLYSQPPFLDQADHHWRLAEMEREVSRLRQALTQEEVERVLATYYEAIRRRPDDWALRFNLGNAYLQLGKPTEAASTFAWLIKTYPTQYAFQLVYGKTLMAMGRADEAQNHLAFARKLAPHDEELRKMRF
ncbi:MAG: tetratricopeptide repeat protein [Verrucomicrobiae bacterium]|nr:tetratricopeptide repeat protein [Verrucomicrobiae bacterium]